MSGQIELDRAKVLDEQFINHVLAKKFPTAKSTTTLQQAGLSQQEFLDLFNSQLVSRHLDLLARRLKAKGEGFYTIGSSGHEGNAAIAKAFTIDDVALLHYRSGAFMIQRAKQKPSSDYIYDQILSLVASSKDPISGGRHKVFGSLSLNVPPQTSTIASHLPKALGMAISINTAKVLKPHSSDYSKFAKNSAVLCSFGDASFNHSTAQGAFNSSAWVAHSNIPLPIVFICEDNQIGISVPTPKGWIKSQMQSKPQINYLSCDGLNLADVYQKAQLAANIAKKKSKPVFLHVHTVRLMGHAGSDIEFHYHSSKQIESIEADDPLLHSARTIIEHGWLTAEQIVAEYEEVQHRLDKAAQDAVLEPKLSSAKEVMASIIPAKREVKFCDYPSPAAREKIFANEYANTKKPRTMAQCINYALTDLMLQYKNITLFGEDVAKKGGVYRITQNLLSRFGPARVFDTLLDEQTILGTAIGMAQNGFIPIPEIQFLAYTHNAEDQLRGEAATLSFFSNGQFTNPMVVRIPGLAYQKGFGGHFHNDNAIAFLREIPGIIVACPSNGKEAALLLREAVRLAYQEQRVVVFIEPIALYSCKDLCESNDGQALTAYPNIQQLAPLGEISIEGTIYSDTVIISYGNGMHLSRQAAKILAERYNIAITLIDIRWLAPLPLGSLKKAILGKKNIVIVDECRRSGSLSEALTTFIFEQIKPLPTVRRICAEDCFIPLGNAWRYILPSSEDIVKTVRQLKTTTIKEKTNG